MYRREKLKIEAASIDAMISSAKRAAADISMDISRAAGAGLSRASGAPSPETKLASGLLPPDTTWTNIS